MIIKNEKIERVEESTYVYTVELSTGETVEIRRLEGGGLVGLDGSYLEQMGDDEHVVDPYEGKPFDVPANELGFAERGDFERMEQLKQQIRELRN